MKLFADQEDEHYGQYRSVKVKQPDGSVRQMDVTDKWLIIQKLKKQMEADPQNWIQANFIGPHGERIEILKIGQDVDRDSVSDLRDSVTGQLYGTYLFKSGKEEVCLTTKSFWNEMKQQIARMQPFIDAEVRQAIDGENRI